MEFLELVEAIVMLAAIAFVLVLLYDFVAYFANLPVIPLPFI